MKKIRYEAPNDGGAPDAAAKAIVPKAAKRRAAAKKKAKPKAKKRPKPKAKKKAPAKRKAKKPAKAKRPKVVKTKRKPGKVKVKPATAVRTERLDFRLTKAEKARVMAKAKKMRRTVTSLFLQAVEKIK